MANPGRIKNLQLGGAWPAWIILYAAGGVLTMLLQILIRLPQCEGLAACSLSLAKAIVWSAIWPAYWLVYLSGLYLSG